MPSSNLLIRLQVLTWQMLQRKVRPFHAKYVNIILDKGPIATFGVRKIHKIFRTFIH